MSGPCNYNSFLRAFFWKNKLSCTNFPVWSKALRNILESEGTEYVLDTELPEAPAYKAPKEERDAFRKHADDALYVQCLMLANMESSFQSQFEHVDTYSMYQRLERGFQAKVRNEKYGLVCALMDCKLEEGQRAGPHIIRMMRMIERLATLGHPIEEGMAVDMVLRSLPARFDQFVSNFNMHFRSTSLPELYATVARIDQDFKEWVVVETQGSESPNVTGSGAAPDDVCHFCYGKSHWMGNCHKYMAGKKRGRKSSGIDSVIGKITHLHIV